MTRDLRLLAAAVLLSALGDIVALVALALRVHDLTGSGLAVSAYFATTLAPVILLAPVAGLIADRVESVRVLVLASLAQAGVAAALAATGDLAAILALSSLLAAGAAISQPAEFALVPVVAGEGRLAEANGIVESARYAGFAAGPLVAGAVAAAGGTRAALLVNALSFLAVAAAGAMLRSRRPPQPAPAGARRDRARDGVAALWGDGVLRVVVTAATAALLFISASLTVEVFYAKDVLHAGDTGYALLCAAWTAGMVAGATGAAPRVPAGALAVGALAALAVQGGGMAAQTAWAVLPAALAGYAVGGVGHGAKNALLRTVIGQRVPGHLHGRAFAAYGAVRNAAELAAIGAGGLLVTAIGPRPALVVAGLGPVAAGLAGLVLLRRRAGGTAAALARAAQPLTG